MNDDNGGAGGKVTANGGNVISGGRKQWECESWRARNQSPTLGAHTHAHGFWVGMGGHRFCASLHPAPNQSQTSRMQGIR